MKKTFGMAETLMPNMVDESNLEDLIREAHEARLLKRWLIAKRDTYANISHEEIKSVCGMFAADKEDESE